MTTYEELKKHVDNFINNTKKEDIKFLMTYIDQDINAGFTPNDSSIELYTVLKNDFINLLNQHADNIIKEEQSSNDLKDKIEQTTRGLFYYLNSRQ